VEEGSLIWGGKGGERGGRLAEEAAHLALRGIAPALALRATAAGVEERVSPGAESFLPLLRSLAQRAWKETKEEGKRPFKVEVLLDVERGFWVIEVLTAPPPEVKRWAFSSSFTEEVRRVLGLIRMQEF
jgi:hypothetical protein